VNGEIWYKVGAEAALIEMRFAGSVFQMRREGAKYGYSD
jgi:hypothetical protein